MKKTTNKLNDILTIIIFCIRISLSPSTKECRKYFILNIIFSIISVILPFLLIFLTSNIIGILAGEGGGDKSVTFFVILCTAVLVINFCLKGIENFKLYCDGMYRDVINNHINLLMMEKSANLDVSFFDSPGFYNEMRDATNNTPLIAYTVFQAFDFIKTIVQLIASIILMARFSILFSLLLSLSIIPSVIFQRKQLEAIYSMQRRMMGDERKLSYLSEILFSKAYVKDAKLFNLFPFIKTKFTVTWNMIFSNKRKLSFKYTVLVTL